LVLLYTYSNIVHTTKKLYCIFTLFDIFIVMTTQKRIWSNTWD